MSEKIARLLPSGYWFCLCDRGCGCARSQRLNPPAVASCAGCGTAKPAEATAVVGRRPRPTRPDA